MCAATRQAHEAAPAGWFEAFGAQGSNRCRNISPNARKSGFCRSRKPFPDKPKYPTLGPHRQRYAQSRLGRAAGSLQHRAAVSRHKPPPARPQTHRGRRLPSKLRMFERCCGIGGSTRRRLPQRWCSQLAREQHTHRCCISPGSPVTSATCHRRSGQLPPGQLPAEATPASLVLVRA